MRTWLVALVVASALTGCTSGAKSVLDTLVYAVRPNANVETTTLTPQLEYLRAVADGQTAFLALGYRESDGTEVYYSGSAEALHLRYGRVVRFTSSQKRIEVFFNSEATTSAWTAMKPGDTLIYERTVDQRPEYTFSQVQSVALTRLNNPPTTVNSVKINRQALVWFEERAKSDKGDLRSIFAVDIQSSAPSVVYSEQCLVKDFCLTLQRWSSSGAS